MAFLSDAALDDTLDYVIANGTQIHICSSEPASYAAIAAAQIGEVAVTLGAVTNAAGGRKTVCPEFTVTAASSATGTHWALSNDTDTLVATGAITPNVAMTDTVDYTFSAFDIVTNEDAA